MRLRIVASWATEMSSSAKSIPASSRAMRSNSFCLMGFRRFESAPSSCWAATRLDDVCESIRSRTASAWVEV